jgi:hypothetical protein
MKMKTRIMLLATLGLLIFVSASCFASEVSWSTKESSPDSLRQAVGLPSITLGNLNPAARNPGLELLCPALYDSPGGYCYYFAPGVSFTNFTATSNITLGDLR